MLTRRTLCTGAAVFTVAAAAPAAIAAALHPDERWILAQLPARLSLADRARALTLWRGLEPSEQAILASLIALPDAARERVAAQLEADLAAGLAA